MAPSSLSPGLNFTERFLVAKHGGRWHHFTRNGDGTWFAEYYGDRFQSKEFADVDRKHSHKDLLASYDLDVAK